MYNHRLNDINSPTYRVWSDIAGIDLSSPLLSMSQSHSPMLYNMFRDYSDDQGKRLKTRYGQKAVSIWNETRNIPSNASGEYWGIDLNGKVIIRLGGYVIAVTDFASFSDESVLDFDENGNLLSREGYYKVLNDESTLLPTSLIVTGPESAYTVFGNKLYIYTPNGIFVTNGDDFNYLFNSATIHSAVGEVTATGSTVADFNAIPQSIAPTMFINCNSSGVGTAYQSANIISPYFKNTYLVSSSEMNGDTYSLKVLGGEALAYVYVNTDGVQTMANLSTPSDEISNIAALEGSTITVLCKGADVNGMSLLGAMQSAVSFDNRVFLAVNSADPNKIIWSAVNDPLYFPETNYVYDDNGYGNISGMSPIDNTLIVIKQDSAGKDAIYIHTPQDTEDDLTPRIYPSVSALHTDGVVNKDCILTFGDEVVYLSNNGLKAIESTRIQYEYAVGHRSSNVDNLLLSMDLSAAAMVVWRDYLCISVGPYLFVADGKRRYKNSQTGAYEYEWFLWGNIGTPYVNKSGTSGTPTDVLLGSISNKGYFVHSESPSNRMFCVNETLCYFENYGEVISDAGGLFVMNIKYNLIKFDPSATTDNEVIYNPEEKTLDNPIVSIVTTPFDAAGNISRYKLSVPQGCIAVVSGDVSFAETHTLGRWKLPYMNDDVETGKPFWLIEDTNVIPLNKAYNNSGADGITHIYRYGKRWKVQSFLLYSYSPMTFEFIEAASRLTGMARF